MNEPLTHEQLKKRGFRLPKRLSFCDLAFRMRVKDIEDHGDFSRLMCQPSKRFINDNHFTVEGVGKFNEGLTIIDTPRSYLSLTCIDHEVTRPVKNNTSFVFCYDNGNWVSSRLDILAVSLVARLFSLDHLMSPSYFKFARADYVVIREPMGKPYLSLAAVYQRKHLEF